MKPWNGAEGLKEIGIRAARIGWDRGAAEQEESQGRKFSAVEPVEGMKHWSGSWTCQPSLSDISSFSGVKILKVVTAAY